jgi:hypothetical protein
VNGQKGTGARDGQPSSAASHDVDSDGNGSISDDGGAPWTDPPTEKSTPQQSTSRTLEVKRKTTAMDRMGTVPMSRGGFIPHGEQLSPMVMDRSQFGVKMEQRGQFVQREGSVHRLQLPFQADYMDDPQQEIHILLVLPRRRLGDEQQTILFGSDSVKLVAPRVIKYGKGSDLAATKCRISWRRCRRTRSSGEKSELGIHVDHKSDADHHHLVMGSIQLKSFWVTMVEELQQSAEQQQVTAVLQSSTNHEQAAVLPKYEVLGTMESFTTTQQRLKCIDSVAESAVQHNNKLTDMEVKGYVRRLTPAVSRVEAANQRAPEVEVHHGFGFGIIPWTGSSRERLPVEKSYGFFWDPGPNCFTFADLVGEFLLEVVLDRRYPRRKEVGWKDKLPGSMESMLKTAELMWNKQKQQPHHLDDHSSVLGIQPIWSTSPTQRLLRGAVGYLGGDPTAAADHQQVQVGIRTHGRDNRGFVMRVSTRRERVEPIPEDHRSNERKSITLDLPIQTKLGFLWDSGADGFTSTATFGEIILEAVTAQSNPTTRKAAAQIGMKRIHQKETRTTSRMTSGFFST